MKNLLTCSVISLFFSLEKTEFKLLNGGKPLSEQTADGNHNNLHCNRANELVYAEQTVNSQTAENPVDNAECKSREEIN